jgi:hypothetical protein
MQRNRAVLASTLKIVVLSIPLLVTFAVPSGSAAKATVTPKVGASCKTSGQIVGTAPNQIICQRTIKKKLSWARYSAASIPAPEISTAPPGSGPSASFLARPSEPSAALTLEMLNAQGAKGYAYIGPTVVGGSAFETFTRPVSTATYQYDLVPKTPETSTTEGMLSLFRLKGSEGLLFKGLVVFGNDFGKTYFLFVKSNEKKTTYSYRNAAWPTDEPSAIKDFNTNGADGYAYFGDLLPDPAQPKVGFRLFAKDVKSKATFTYSFKPGLSDRALALAEANLLGQDRAVWKGGYLFGVGTPEMQSRSLYETSSLTAKPVSYSFDSPVAATIDQYIFAANENSRKSNLLLWGQYQFGSEAVTVYVNGPMTTLPLVGVVVP